MSGKPATPPASRVVPGAPRLLVYVADPRQLEPGDSGVPRGPPPCDPAPASLAAVPVPPDVYQTDNSHQHNCLPIQNNVFRTTWEPNDQRNIGISDSTIHKTVHERGDKCLSVYGENSVAHRSDFFTLPQGFLKNPNIKIDDNRISNTLSNNLVQLKQDSNTIHVEYPSSVDKFQNKVSSEICDLQPYELRCPPMGLGNGSIQSITLNQIQRQRDLTNECLNNNLIDTRVISERDKHFGCVNYQFLEQNVSHQSIVNQSINILNEQVGVERVITGESEAGSGTALVRTADGSLLAVLPSPAASTPVVGAALGISAPAITSRSEPLESVSVPLGWRRIISGNSVLYIR